MMKMIKKHGIPALALFPYTLLTPLLVSAQAVSSSGDGGGLQNPLQVDTIEKFLTAILDILLIFAVPIIVFFIVYAGFMYVTAQGDTTKLQKARSAITWAVVGGVIVLGAHAIAKIIESTVGQI